ncbi:hypothetical protein J6590_103941, partial [Homalodisca vitripennis]
YGFGYYLEGYLARDLRSGKYRLEIPLTNSEGFGSEKNIVRDNTQIQDQIT